MNELSYDVLVCEGAERARELRMPDGSPIVSSPCASTLIIGERGGVDAQGAEWIATGTVTGKRQVGGRKEVDLNVWTENAAGERTTPGAAVVVVDD